MAHIESQNHILKVKSGKTIAIFVTLAGMVSVGALMMSDSYGFDFAQHGTYPAFTADIFDPVENVVPRIHEGTVVSANPIRFDETVSIAAITAAAVGMTVTNNNVAFIEYVGHLGNEVIVRVDVINESPEKLLGIVRIHTDKHTIASLNEANSTFNTIRLLGHNKWLVHFDATNGNADTMAISITALEPGIHHVKIHIEAV